jgi:hypothetical protein
MKKLLLLFFLFASSTLFAQYVPTFDTVKFKRPAGLVDAGMIYELITYPTADSIKINGKMYHTTSSLTNYWKAFSATKIEPADTTDMLRYPACPSFVQSSALTGKGKPLYYWAKSKMIAMKTDVQVIINNGDTMATDGTYQFETASASDTVYVDSIAKLTDGVTISNQGTGSTLRILSVEGAHFDTAHSILLATNQWVKITPASTKFVVNGTTKIAETDPVWVADSSKYLNATETRVLIHDSIIQTKDSMYRYSAYSSGNNNAEVYATGEGITCALTGGNTFTFTVPAGVRVTSVKIRIENQSSINVYMGTSDMKNTSYADKWMPIVQAWREDTGAQLMGVTTSMTVSGPVAYDAFRVNGLINTTKNQVRITF